MPDIFEVFTELRTIIFASSDTTRFALLKGSLPPSIFSVKLEYLAIHNNLFTNLPDTACNATSLQYLDISLNQFSGATTENGPLSCLAYLPNLKVYDFSENLYTGDFPLEYANFPALEFFAAFNSFPGLIKKRVFPTWVYNLTRLTTLRLGMNNLVGTVGSEIAQLSQLSELQLTLNALSGTLPSELLQLGQLTSLTLEKNSFSGTVPNMNSLSLLRYFTVGQNKFSGTLPTLPGRLSLFMISDNQITGTIPSSLPSSLTFFDAGGNDLKGTIPLSICLPPLSSIALPGNREITGTIPSCLWSSTTISVLNLPSTNLEGTLPAIIRSSSLAEVVLSDTRVSGKLPEFSSAMQDFHAAKCAFSGTIPESYGITFSTGELNLKYNQLSGYIPSNICDVHYLNLIGNEDFYCPLPSCCGTGTTVCPTGCVESPYYDE